MSKKRKRGSWYRYGSHLRYCPFFSLRKIISTGEATYAGYKIEDSRSYRWIDVSAPDRWHALPLKKYGTLGVLKAQTKSMLLEMIDKQHGVRERRLTNDHVHQP